MHLGLDIDGTITSDPGFYAALAKTWRSRSGEVHVVTSRGEPARADTTQELRQLGLEWDELHFLPGFEEADRSCPHGELDWYQRYLYGKVAYCRERGITRFVDDDEKVLALFARFGEGIVAAHPRERERIEGWVPGGVTLAARNGHAVAPRDGARTGQ